MTMKGKKCVDVCTFVSAYVSRDLWNFCFSVNIFQSYTWINDKEKIFSYNMQCLFYNQTGVQILVQYNPWETGLLLDWAKKSGEK